MLNGGNLYSSVSRNDDDNELLESDSRINNNDEEENFSGHSFLCGIISNNHVQKQKRKKIMVSLSH